MHEQFSDCYTDRTPFYQWNIEKKKGAIFTQNTVVLKVSL